MKDKDRAFFSALDTLTAQGINGMEAAHWPDKDLRTVLTEQQVRGWRRWFYAGISNKRKNLEIGRAE